MYGESLLSKVIEQNDVSALKRLDIREDHFMTEVERKTYRFIMDYAESNRGKAPDYRTVEAEVDGFTFIPNVSDSFTWLARNVKDHATKVALRRLLEEQAGEKFSELDGENFSNWLISEIERVKINANIRSQIGTDIKKDTQKFLEEYRKRKSGESLKIWKSHFPTINREIGGYASSNVYTWFGRSGRGKSIITMEEAIEAAMQGANVLIWSMEMGWYEVLVRIYVSISGREEVVPQKYLNIDMDAGFNAQDVRYGKLADDFEAGFETFLSTINDIIPGTIIVRAVDDEDFVRRDLRQLEADIAETNADVVVIDPFYYLDYEKNTSKTAGGDAAETSKKLRRLAGRTQTVIHAVTQADENSKEGDVSERELLMPKRAEVKKTKALLEDASNLFAIDTLNDEKRGMIGLGKGRHGGEGVSFEVIYMPQYGVVKEPDIDAYKFDF